MVNYSWKGLINEKKRFVLPFTYDLQMTRHYELLNYSEHGTTVDNVLYSCDFSDKLSMTTSQTSNVVGNVRKLIGKGKNKEEPAPTLLTDKDLMSSRTNEVSN